MNTPTHDDEREREQMEALVQKFCTKEKARTAARANNNDAFGKSMRVIRSTICAKI